MTKITIKPALPRRHERHSPDHRPADQRPGPRAGGSDHGLRLALRRLWLHLRMEPVLHVRGVRSAVEGLPEDAGAGPEGRTEGAAGAQTAEPTERYHKPRVLGPSEAEPEWGMPRHSSSKLGVSKG